MAKKQGFRGDLPGYRDDCGEKAGSGCGWCCEKPEDRQANPDDYGNRQDQPGFTLGHIRPEAIHRTFVLIKLCRDIGFQHVKILFE